MIIAETIETKKTKLTQQICALYLSAEKWKRIATASSDVDPYMLDNGASDCACCQLWYINPPAPRCFGCPIAEESGEPGCLDTPYDAWKKNQYAAATYIEPRILALAEYEFITGLTLRLIERYKDVQNS